MQKLSEIKSRKCVIITKNLIKNARIFTNLTNYAGCGFSLLYIPRVEL